MKPPEFDYEAPATLEGALELLGADEDAKVLAGGQSLLPLLGMRLSEPSLLVDLRRIPGLDEVQRSDGVVRIGAMVRQRQAERDPGVATAAPLLAKATRCIAHPQIRSRGTIGGSVVHADPAAEIPAVLVALDGRVRSVSATSEHVRRAEEFFTGFLATALPAGEIVTGIELDVPRRRTGAACVEISQRAGDYALCGAVAQVSLSSAGAVQDACVALFGLGDRPVRARATEQALSGQQPTPAAIVAAAGHAGDDAEPIDDPQAPAEYRLHLAEVVTRRALDQALKEAAR